MNKQYVVIPDKYSDLEVRKELWLNKMNLEVIGLEMALEATKVGERDEKG